MNCPIIIGRKDLKGFIINPSLASGNKDESEDDEFMRRLDKAKQGNYTFHKDRI